MSDVLLNNHNSSSSLGFMHVFIYLLYQSAQRKQTKGRDPKRGVSKTEHWKGWRGDESCRMKEHGGNRHNAGACLLYVVMFLPGEQQNADRSELFVRLRMCLAVTYEGLHCVKLSTLRTAKRWSTRSPMLMLRPSVTSARLLFITEISYFLVQEKQEFVCLFFFQMHSRFLGNASFYPLAS